MIELYCEADCSQAADIEATLKELVVAHKVVLLEPGRYRTSFGKENRLPALKDKDKLISGVEEIDAYLLELESFVASWRKFQSDSCYCDEDE